MTKAKSEAPHKAPRKSGRKSGATKDQRSPEELATGLDASGPALPEPGAPAPDAAGSIGPETGKVKVEKGGRMRQGARATTGAANRAANGGAKDAAKGAGKGARKGDFKGAAKKAPAGLELLREAKLTELFAGTIEEQHAASGVHCHDGLLYITFENYAHLACLTPDLTVPEGGPALIRQRGERIGYEDLTYDPYKARWYCLVEATESEPDVYRARIEEFDETFRFIESLELDYKIKNGKRGLGGLSYLRYKGEDYLLALCAGNACKGGSAGREGGKGRILLFQRGLRRWEHVGTVKLPKAVAFEDYAGLDFRHGLFAVASQASAAVWVGRIKEEPAGLDDLWAGDGRTFPLPRKKKDRPLFCTVAGVTWLDDEVVAIASAPGKGGKQDDGCAAHGQAVQVFRIPAKQG